MLFELVIPSANTDPLNIKLKTGDFLFILGANGTGKSSLIYNFYKLYPVNSRRITAHRQTWFSSNAVTLSPEQKRNTENNIQSSDASPQSRWKDDYSAQRASIAIYDLIDAENVRARSIAEAVDHDNINLAKVLAKEDAPIKTINELLRLSNLGIEISVRKNEEVVAKKISGDPYSIAELSDGERNAILIAANVLTAPSDCLLLIDEPERHLHRSIISPLLTLLFAKRSDCAFVVSTHDLMLSVDNPDAKTLLIRGCEYNQSNTISWDVDLLPPRSHIDDALKRDILGSRRKILFVEGEERSLDKSLYNIIFPNISIVAKGSCRDVQQAVVGIRGSMELNWLSAFGIIDNDGRALRNINNLRDKGIYSLPCYSVESIYYHPEIQLKLLEHALGKSKHESKKILDDVNYALFRSIESHQKRLSDKVVEKVIRNELDLNWPKPKDISVGNPINLHIDVALFVKRELENISESIKNKDVEKIISRYPIRETPALNTIAQKIGYKGCNEYEAAVRKLLMENELALKFVRSLFETLCTDLNTSIL